MSILSIILNFFIFWGIFGACIGIFLPKKLFGNVKNTLTIFFLCGPISWIAAILTLAILGFCTYVEENE